MAIAYTTIRMGGTTDKETGVTEYDILNPGDSVSQDDLGVSDEVWASYYRDYVVGEDPLPDDVEEGETLTQYYIRKANEQLAAAQAGEGPIEIPAALRGTDAPPGQPPQAGTPPESTTKPPQSNQEGGK